MSINKVGIPDFASMKAKSQKIVALTAYDYVSARLVDAAGVDVILVGDSLGAVVQGSKNTLGVSMDEMIYHSRLVSSGTSRALVVADMPFLSFQVSIEEAVRNAGSLVQRGGVEMVKLEGGAVWAETVKRIVAAGIPVMGHIGLCPQSVNKLGGYKVQGRKAKDAEMLKNDALALEASGVSAIVLEAIPGNLAKEITESVRVPTIGIGAGKECDGQILVFHDLLGYQSENDSPKFVKRYAELGKEIRGAVSQYASEVREEVFPSNVFEY